MRVRYTREAFADRERILEYLTERSPSGARNVAASIREAVTQLAVNRSVAIELKMPTSV